MAGYYYRQLDREKRGVYDAMLAGMEALAPGIRVPRLDGPELSDIYLRLKLDTPLLFYVTGFQYRWMPGADHVELLPEYLFDKGKIRWTGKSAGYTTPCWRVWRPWPRGSGCPGWTARSCRTSICG